MGEAFPRKYRPKSIDDYLGETLRNKMKNIFADEDKYPQTILLHGTRGCGKTTLARIIAKEFMCMDKIDGHACGVCDMCKEIDNNLIEAEAGSQVIGVTELNIATDGGKADINELLEDAMIEPMYPLKRKVYILDECHMLTKAAQNALLKIVEEPPKWLVFILCTTNPEGLLPTLKDRCQEKLAVKKASLDELVDRLLYICKQEGIKTSMEALKLIANSCNRNPRDSMMKLESISKNFGLKCTLENVMKEINVVASEIYIEYFKCVNKSLEDILRFTNKLNEQNIEPKEFIKGLTNFTLQCINIKYGIGLDNYTAEFIKSVKDFFNIYNTEDLDCLLQILEYANKMINADDTMGELLINTTAMRIGKIKLLAVGLQNEAMAAENENRKGNRKSIEKVKEETNKNTIVGRELEDALIVATFGKNVTEIKGGAQIGITENEESEHDDRKLTDEELLKMFSDM